MRIVRYQADGASAYGSLDDDGSISAITGDVFGDFDVGSKIGDLGSTKLLAPLEPPTIVAVGLNYLKHILEGPGADATPKMPVLFQKPSRAVIGSGESIVLPKSEDFTHGINDPDLKDDPIGKVEYEAELVVVIGKQCRSVSEEEALDYVLGYTCGNDVSARSLQFAEMAKGALWLGKGMDTFAPMGPCIATGLDPADLGIQARLNGKIVQDSSTSDLLFGVASLIAYISQGATLYPGDCIFTGTPSGVGPLSPGDTIEVEIEGVGTLSNPVVSS